MKDLPILNISNNKGYWNLVSSFFVMFSWPTLHASAIAPRTAPHFSRPGVIASTVLQTNSVRLKCDFVRFSSPSSHRLPPMQSSNFASTGQGFSYVVQAPLTAFLEPGFLKQYIRGPGLWMLLPKSSSNVLIWREVACGKAIGETSVGPRCAKVEWVSIMR